MDTTVNNSGPVAAQTRTTQSAHDAAPADAPAAAPEKVETPQAVPAADTTQKAALQQPGPSSALTTYKDEDSGRLIVRVYDRKNGDILVEFPPERAFRTVQEVLSGVGLKPKKNFSV
jgi:hypothetical protein